MVNPFPILNQPIMRTGIFKINNNTPVLISNDKKSLNILDKSCAAPLNPLAYTFALMRKKFNDNANRKEPTITTAIRFASMKNIGHFILLLYERVKRVILLSHILSIVYIIILLSRLYHF